MKIPDLFTALALGTQRKDLGKKYKTFGTDFTGYTVLKDKTLDSRLHGNDAFLWCVRQNIAEKKAYYLSGDGDK